MKIAIAADHAGFVGGRFLNLPLDSKSQIILVGGRRLVCPFDSKSQFTFLTGSK